MAKVTIEREFAADIEFTAATPEMCLELVLALMDTLPDDDPEWLFVRLETDGNTFELDYQTHVWTRIEE